MQGSSKNEINQRNRVRTQDRKDKIEQYKAEPNEGRSPESQTNVFKVPSSPNHWIYFLTNTSRIRKKPDVYLSLRRNHVRAFIESNGMR